MTSPIILCIEDEDDLRIDVADELAAAGYTVLQASNGEEALRVLDKERPDLVLCDITMPGLGGYDVLARMREPDGKLADIPFIFLTALADRDAMLAGKQAGADDYLVKPIDFDLLLATVATRLEQVSRVRDKAVEQAYEAWQRLANGSERRTVEILQKAARVLGRFQIGVFLVDRSGAVRFMNDEAERIVGTNDGLVISQGILKGTHARQSALLQEAIERAFSRSSEDEVLSFPRSSGARPCLLMVPGQRLSTNEEPDTVAILAVDTDLQTKVSGETLAQLFGLTPAETRLALLLVDGKRLDQIAEELGVSPTTVSFHLKNLFRKTDTHRQVDLIRVLLAIPFRTSAE